jgi:hypothetical protein
MKPHHDQDPDYNHNLVEIDPIDLLFVCVVGVTFILVVCLLW